MVEDDWGLWADHQEKRLASLNNLKSDGTDPITPLVPASQYAHQKPNPASILLKKKSIKTHLGPTSQRSSQELKPDFISLTQTPTRTYLRPPSQYTPQAPNSAFMSLIQKPIRTHIGPSLQRAPQEPNSDSISLIQKPIRTCIGPPSQRTPQEPNPASISLISQKHIRTHLRSASQYIPQEPNSDSISLIQKPIRTHIGPPSKRAPQKPNSISMSLMQKLIRTHLIDTSNRIDLEIRKIDTNSPFYSVKSFEDFNLRPELLKGVYSMGFNGPSRIQERVLSLLTADPPQNLIAQSQSGTGKTIAAIIAALHRVDSNLHYPHVLMLSPIFEFAVRTGKVAKKMAQFCPNIEVRFAIRGENLERGHRITEQLLIGTPGKVFDWAVRYRFFDLKRIQLFVLDVADLMITTQGHEDQSIRIHKQLSKDCQKMLFATAFSDELMNFAKHIAPDPVIIRLKKEEEILNNIKQYYTVCKSPEVKYEALDSLCGALCFVRIVIFCNIKRTAAWLVGKMTEEGHDMALLTGELAVEQRMNALNRFREGKEKILITTNAYASAIDVEQVAVVINYDLPVHFKGDADCEAYLHRIGRTGRFGKTGLVINLIDGGESMAILEQIESHFGKKINEIDDNEVDSIEAMAK
ncbi:ATP-dependent RNA helicase DDX19A-like isoform X2 [Argiope bruennichi]|nr:ATP-dependent RNA helicase DDX19A-like isoform X2 [Argiope bruennichi]XP_055925297.1 ATP-dependent RNA helicase DDX19A-like isoform X2 [Argiope bruennichi]